MADEDQGSPAPFVGALVVFVLVVTGLLVFTLTRGDGLTEEQRVGRAAVGQNDALQRENYADYQGFTCGQESGDESKVLAAQRESVRQHGARYVDDVTDVKIDGDRATAKVTYHFENAPDDERTTDLSFSREDGAWKVCSAYR